MIIQRKLLTAKQKNDICKKYYGKCNDCPLFAKILGEHFCIYNLDEVKTAVEDYLNEEITIE